jgi:hypothetical protein
MQRTTWIAALLASTLAFACAAPATDRSEQQQQHDDAVAQSTAQEIRLHGFEFKETLRGTYSIVGESSVPRTMTLSVHARTDDFDKFENDRLAQIDGSVDMKGFATNQPLKGTLFIDVFETHKITYVFDFKSDTGEKLSFIGTKDVDFFDLIDSLTTLPGEVKDASGHVIAKTHLVFDIQRELGRWLRSLKFLF